MIGVFLTTFREGIRSKVLWSLLLFGAFLLAAALLFPAVNEADRARFLASWSLSLSTVVGALALLFLAAPSGAREAEERTLHQVLVKPVNRFAWFAGRVFAYGALSMLLFLAMGMGSHLLLGIAVPPESAKDSPLLHPRRVVEASSMTIQGERLPSADREIPEWLDPKGKIVYDFPDLSELAAEAGRAPDSKPPKLLVALPGSLTLDHKSFVQLAIRLENRRTGQIWPYYLVSGQEEKTLDLDPGLLSGPVRAEVYSSGGGIGLGDRKWPERIGVRLLLDQPGSLFENYLGAFLRRGMAVFLLLSIAFLLSLLMNGKLALTASLVLLLAGSYPGTTKVVGRIFRGEIVADHGHSESKPGENHEHGHEEEGGPGRWTISILAYAADGLAFVLPDLDRFDSSDDLISGYNLSSRRDLNLLLYLGAYVALIVVAGGVAAACREWK